MPMASLEVYLDRLPTRYAELKLVLADVVSLPHMKESNRRTTLNGWERAINMVISKISKPISKARLKLMGIGVNMVPVDQQTNTENE